MEQHPVPQNVTTFQFRLIGDMTIKQFGYLAGGAILAFLSYKLPLPFFFTWPATVLFGLLGFGFAFVPIEERPMDVWVLSFLRNVYSPTQFIWHRSPASSEPKIVEQRVVVPLVSAQTTAATATITQRPVVSEKISGLFTQQSQPTIEKTSFMDKLFGWLDELFSKQTVVTQPIISVQSQIPIIKQSPVVKQVPAAPSSEYLDLQIKINALEKQLNEKTKIEPVRTPIPPLPIQTQKPALHFTPTTQKGPTVKIIPPESATRAGLPRLTTFSNVVTGIVKDNVGGLLPGVLVTVRDKEGVPLRALKTNKLGQFAASTQLPNGTYLVEIEDPRNRFVFDRAQITLNGTVMPAIEIIAKSKREINREELSKQIFGQTVNS